MPANEELQFIAKLIEEGNLRLAIDEGVTADCFADDGALQLWNSVVAFYESKEGSGTVPTRERIEDRFPHIPLPRPGRTPLEAHIKDLLDYRINKTLGALADDILDHNKKHADLDALLARSLERLQEASRTRRTGKDIEISNYMQETLARYERYENPDSIQGIPYPWRPLNEETRGIQNREMIVMYGRPKSMKTWVLLAMAVHAYNHNRRVLVYTREMSPEKMMDRTACLLINAPYSAYLKGKLGQIPVWEGGTMKDRLNDLRNTIQTDENTCRLESGYNKGFILTADQSQRGEYGGGVKGLQQKIKDYNPDIIFVDAAYLLKNDKSGKRSVKWEDQADVVTELKETAMIFNRPVVITTQANRDSEDARGFSVRNIAFADAYGMNADLCIEVNKEETGDPERNLLALCIPAAREINLYGFVIHGNAATDFGMVMRKKRNEEGVVLTNENGEPEMEPTVFYQRKEVAAFFKNSDNLKQERARNSNEPKTPAGLSNMIHHRAAAQLREEAKKGKRK